MNKGDVILIFILAATIVFFGSNFWLIINEYEQWSAGFITAFTAIFAGEILAFAAYRSLKAKYKSKYDSVEMEESEDDGKAEK